MSLSILFSHSTTQRLWKLAFVACFLLTTIAGCDSKKPDIDPAAANPKADTPNTSIPKTSNPDQNTSPEPPGEIEMPTGDLPPTLNTTPGAATGLEMPTKSDATASENLTVASWDEVEKMATAGGKITVVDIWSTSCAPCIKELPGLAKVQKTMGDKVKCIALDVDYYGSKRKPPEFYRADVQKVLDAVGIGFPSYICSTPSDDLFAKIEIISIPAVLIYDADGKLVRKFVDAGDDAGFTYDKNVIPLLESMNK